ncbi:MAG TPA: hypothetical protein ENJ02_07635 [Chloroflexi bacterium]|nr:hypothetical protein [Chloroflexota bacterium]
MPPLYCAYHPDRETTLRCNRCEKPICPQCAILTPTGYRCPDCVREIQRKFDTAEWYDYPVAFVIAALLSGIGNVLAAFLGFWGLFVALVAGYAIAEGTRKATRKRRSAWLYRSTAVGAVVGSLPFLLPGFLLLLAGLDEGNLVAFYPLILQGLYTFLVATTAYQRLKGLVL